jgi:DNA (cytosine-5)-methyltransferase 1
MAISYKPLWHLLLEKEMKKMEFRDVVGISNGTLARLGKNDPVSLDVIEKICITLGCNIEDVVQILPGRE